MIHRSPVSKAGRASPRFQQVRRLPAKAMGARPLPSRAVGKQLSSSRSPRMEPLFGATGTRPKQRASKEGQHRDLHGSNTQQSGGEGLQVPSTLNQQSHRDYSCLRGMLRGCAQQSYGGREALACPVRGPMLSGPGKQSIKCKKIILETRFKAVCPVGF